MMMTQNEELMQLIPASKIFPLIANANTSYPFIVYSREQLNPIYTKDLLAENEVSFTVIVVSNDYEQSLEIANAVRHSLESYRYSDNNIRIHPIKLTNITEETLDDAYIQRMNYSFVAD